MKIGGRECTNQHDLLTAILIEAGAIDAEILRPNGHDGRIADAVFLDDGWIFEVKSLENDRAADPNVQQKTGEILAAHAPIFGGPIPFGTVRVDVTKLPEPTAKDVIRNIGRAVRDAVKNANQQIKATQRLLDRPMLGCVAIICPPHELDHEVIRWVVADSVRQGNRSVNLVAVAQTPLLASFGRTTGSSSLVFQGREGVRPAADLIARIGKAWSETHGQPLIYGFPPNGGR